MKLHVRSMLFRSPRSKLLAAGASFAAIALFALILPATVASGQTSASTSTLQEAGVLRLALGGAGQPEVPRAERRRGVSAGLGTAVDLGKRVPAGAVRSSPSCRTRRYPTTLSRASSATRSGSAAAARAIGQPCGRIDPGQTLTMNLGSGLAGKVIDYAEIDLELKFGGQVTGRRAISCRERRPRRSASRRPTRRPARTRVRTRATATTIRVRFPRSGTTAVNRLVFSVGVDGERIARGWSRRHRPLRCGGCAGVWNAQPRPVARQHDRHPLPPHRGGRSARLRRRLRPDPGWWRHPDEQLGTPGQRRWPSVHADPLQPRLGSTDVGGAAPDEQTLLQCILLQKDLLGQNAQFFWTVTWAPETAHTRRTDASSTSDPGRPPTLSSCAPLTPTGFRR